MRVFLRAEFWAVFSSASLLALSFASPSKAQESIAASPFIGSGSVGAIAGLQAQVQEAAMQGTALIMEGAVDPNEYTVGPGDKFSIAIGGPLPNAVITAVSSAGYLDLPNSGQILAAGQSLHEVRTQALSVLRDFHANVPISISLSQPRAFYVHISGAVPHPGRHLMLPISRVDELITASFTPKLFDLQSDEYIYLPSRRPELLEDYVPAFRSVRIEHRDGGITTADLIRYYIHGSLEDNPYLQDGDRVIISSFHESHGGVRITGDIAYEGTYDIHPGETASELLEIAAGPEGLDMLTQVRLIRSSIMESRTFNVGRVINGEEEDPELRPGDVLSILVTLPTTARVQGRVNFPGTYKIIEGQSTVNDLIDMAGGLHPDASIENAFLERTFSMDLRESPEQTNWNFFTRQFATSVNQKPAHRVNIDIASIINGEDSTAVLYDGDRLVFPRDEGTIRVLGHVVRPGYTRFMEGQSAQYYIDQSGGLAPGVREVFVLSERTGNTLSGLNAPVKPGDTIFVDRDIIADSPQMQSLAINQQTLQIQRISTILAGVSAVTAIITTVVAITR